MAYGEIIKKRRLEKNLSLDDIFAMIKIKKKYIIAFEEEDYVAMPKEPFSFGFFKNYLACLEIKDLSLLDEYKEKQKLFLQNLNNTNNITKDNPFKKRSSYNYNIKKDADSPSIFVKKKDNFSLFITIIIIIILSTFLILNMLLKNIKKNLDTEFITINQTLLEKKEYKHIFELTMNSPEACWVVIKNKEKTLFNGLLKKNINNTWLDFNGFEIFIGNKNNLKVMLNDKKLNIFNYKSGEKIIVNEDSLQNKELFL